MELANKLPHDQFAPPSEDHILKFNVDEDIIIAKDEDGKELCRMAFEYDDRTIHFKSPIISKYPAFVKKLALLFGYLAQYAPNLEMPDSNVEFFNNAAGNELWERLSSVAVCANPMVKKMILELFFEYLDGKISGLSLPKKKYWTQKYYQKKLIKFQISWFENTFRMGAVQKVFAACLCIDDLLKKNAQFLLEKKYNLPHSTPSNSKSSSAKRQDSTTTNTTPTQSFSFELL